MDKPPSKNLPNEQAPAKVSDPETPGPAQSHPSGRHSVDTPNAAGAEGEAASVSAAAKGGASDAQRAKARAAGNGGRDGGRSDSQRAISLARMTLYATIAAVLIAAASLALAPEIRESIYAILSLRNHKPLPKFDEGELVVGVAHLEGDRSDYGRGLVVAALAQLDGIRVAEFDRTIEVGGTAKIEAGHKRAREYLRKSGAILLIWGIWLDGGGKQAVRLYMTAPTASDVTGSASQYEADVTLDPSFWADFVKVVQLAVFDRGMSVEKPGFCTLAAVQLGKLADDVRALVYGSEGRKWDASTRARVKLVLSSAASILGNLTGERERFLEAVDFSREALKESSQQQDTETWTLAHIALGASLVNLSGQFGQPGPDEEAMQAFRKALDVPQPVETKIELQAALGMFAAMKGQQKGDLKLLGEGLGTCREAVNEAMRVSDPTYLGIAQM